MAEGPIPYRVWQGVTTFRKNGTPVLGSVGASAARVIVMTADTFKRFMREHPDAADIKIELGDLDA